MRISEMHRVIYEAVGKCLHKRGIKLEDLSQEVKDAIASGNVGGGGSGGSGSFVFTQNAVSATWNVTHTLNTTRPVVSVFESMPDGTFQKVAGTYEDYTTATATSITLNFQDAISGFAILLG